MTRSIRVLSFRTLHRESKTLLPLNDTFYRLLFNPKESRRICPGRQLHLWPFMRLNCHVNLDAKIIITLSCLSPSPEVTAVASLPIHDFKNRWIPEEEKNTNSANLSQKRLDYDYKKKNVLLNVAVLSINFFFFFFFFFFSLTVCVCVLLQFFF